MSQQSTELFTINIFEMLEEKYQEIYRINKIPTLQPQSIIKIINLRGQTKAYPLYTQQILSKIQLKQEELLLASDFGIENEDCEELYNFIMFMYTGRLNIKKSNGSSLFYQYLLLAIRFKVNKLIEQLMMIGQENVILLYRSAFLNAIVIAYQNTWFKEEYDKQEKIFENFFSLLIKTNLVLLENENPKKMQILQNTFAKMKPNTFQWLLKFVKIHSQKALYTIQELFLHFKTSKELIQQSYSEGELILIQEVVNLYDWQSFTKFKNQLNPTSINYIQQSLERKQCFHFVRNVQCDQQQEYFQASCGHFICLRCFYDYFAFKSKLLNPNTEKNQYPQKIRCLSRQTDPSLCDLVYNKNEFSQLKNLQNHPIMITYLK